MRAPLAGSALGIRTVRTLLAGVLLCGLMASWSPAAAQGGGDLPWRSRMDNLKT
ncbi:MAG: hypothetical protein QF903_05890 [Planctomycetota bacterium]|nr:hypothetical protein [Planctomycetota bacterium]MDP6988990.1 hypothetical protein [Planctomycetota bacterium]